MKLMAVVTLDWEPELQIWKQNRLPNFESDQGEENTARQRLKLYLQFF